MYGKQHFVYQYCVAKENVLRLKIEKSKAEIETEVQKFSTAIYLENFFFKKTMLSKWQENMNKYIN